MYVLRTGDKVQRADAAALRQNVKSIARRVVGLPAYTEYRNHRDATRFRVRSKTRTNSTTVRPYSDFNNWSSGYVEIVMSFGHK